MPTIYVNDKGELPKRRLFDFYPTERSLVRKALPIVFPMQDVIESGKKLPSIRILDPGAGAGVWGMESRRYFQQFFETVDLVGVEIQEGVPPNPVYDRWYTHDFMQWEGEEEPFHIVLGNPPFKWGETFVQHAMNFLKPSGIMAYLLPLDFLCSDSRYEELYRQYPLTKLYPIARRASFTGDRKTGGTNYAIFKWVKDWGTPYSFSATQFTYERDRKLDPVLNIKDKTLDEVLSEYLLLIRGQVLEEFGELRKDAYYDFDEPKFPPNSEN